MFTLNFFGLFFFLTIITGALVYKELNRHRSLDFLVKLINSFPTYESTQEKIFTTTTKNGIHIRFSLQNETRLFSVEISENCNGQIRPLEDLLLYIPRENFLLLNNSHKKEIYSHLDELLKKHNKLL